MRWESWVLPGIEPVQNEVAQAKSGGARDTSHFVATSAQEAGNQGRAVGPEPITAR